jgi:hypothetical protein
MRESRAVLVSHANAPSGNPLLKVQEFLKYPEGTAEVLDVTLILLILILSSLFHFNIVRLSAEELGHCLHPLVVRDSPAHEPKPQLEVPHRRDCAFSTGSRMHPDAEGDREQREVFNRRGLQSNRPPYRRAATMA